ncbi:hypothetical protein [Knoellia koreensis]|uniref:MftR C-terminal domain-containing protein n=1 Tax=Knoellia koreensis TaxID=2730921 RepID=A0A849HEE6_9MICO|nr:hypothetical protein [Knoellia sp. DB2414S]NNM44581.1 hypothetical protein [Knoellia sp. DB2414S]
MISWKGSVRNAMAIVTSAAEDPEGALVDDMIRAALADDAAEDVAHALAVIAASALGIAARWEGLPDDKVRQAVFTHVQTVLEGME